MVKFDKQENGENNNNDLKTSFFKKKKKTSQSAGSLVNFLECAAGCEEWNWIYFISVEAWLLHLVSLFLS